MTDWSVYARIVEALPLTEDDRLGLKQKRGFSDEVIDRMRFKSCGPFIANDPFFTSQAPEIYDALVKPNVLIPYFGPDGQIVHIRPHKFGIKGEAIQIYIPFQYLGADTTRLLIAESEFKALASCLLGVPAIGIPGISSFSRERFNQLPDTLHALGCKEAVICFDNEIKDDPTLPNYKPDYTKRYDTQLYAYVMATLIKGAGIDCTIANLKDEWRVNGKADIDGCLAQGVRPDNYQLCIRKGILPHVYRERWVMPPAHRSYLERRIDRFFYKGPISERFLCYFAKSAKGEQQISNFTIEVIQTLQGTTNKTDRLCRFLSSYGNSEVVTLTPEMMTSLQAFKRTCIEMGDYTFSGSEANMQDIWKYIFMNQDGRTVRQLRSYGYDEESKIWFFGNGAYTEDQFFPVDENGIVWIHDMGYRLMDAPDTDIPVLSDAVSDVTIQSVLEKLSVVIGPDYAKLLFGWACGHYFLPEIMETYGTYPFFFLYGKAASGKSTTANWISAFFGFIQKGIAFHGSTLVGLQRTTSQMSMVPIWFEEYRNKDPDIGKKNNFLRGIYDKSAIVKGSKKDMEIKTYKARSTLIISGEELPNDAALNSRLLVMPLYRDDEHQKSSAEFEWLQSRRLMFNQIGHHILTNKHKIWPVMKERIASYLLSFDDLSGEKSVSSRNKVQMSIIAGIADSLLGENQAFSIFVGKTALDNEQKFRSDQALNIFFDDVANLICAVRIKTRILELAFQPANHVNLWFQVAYAEWETYLKGLRNDIPASKIALYEHLKREPYYIGHKNARVGGKVAKCIVLAVDHPKFPESLKMALASQEETILGQQQIMAGLDQGVREES